MLLRGSSFSVKVETGSVVFLIVRSYVALLIYLISCFRFVEAEFGSCDLAFLVLGFGVLDFAEALLLPALVVLRVSFKPVLGLSRTLVVNFDVCVAFDAAGLPALVSLDVRMCCDRESSAPFNRGYGSFTLFAVEGIARELFVLTSERPTGLTGFIRLGCFVAVARMIAVCLFGKAPTGLDPATVLGRYGDAYVISSPRDFGLSSAMIFTGSPVFCWFDAVSRSVDR